MQEPAEVSQNVGESSTVYGSRQEMVVHRSPSNLERIWARFLTANGWATVGLSLVNDTARPTFLTVRQQLANVFPNHFMLLREIIWENLLSQRTETVCSKPFFQICYFKGKYFCHLLLYFTSNFKLHVRFICDTSKNEIFKNRF